MEKRCGCRLHCPALIRGGRKPLGWEGGSYVIEKLRDKNFVEVRLAGAAYQRVKSGLHKAARRMGMEIITERTKDKVLVWRLFGLK